MDHPSIIDYLSLLCRFPSKKASPRADRSLICYKHNRICESADPHLEAFKPAELFRTYYTSFVRVFARSGRKIPYKIKKCQLFAKNGRVRIAITSIRSEQTKTARILAASRFNVCAINLRRGDRSGRPRWALCRNSPRRDRRESCAGRCPQSCPRGCCRGD